MKSRRFLQLGAMVALIGLLSSPAAAQLADLASAEQAYRSGDYAQAASVYQRITDQGVGSGELYYNLGNCYYKLGQFGRAILNYERARKYLGNDPDLEVNLKLANLNVPDRIQPLPRLFIVQIFSAVQDSLTERGWAGIAIFSEWILLACLVGLQWQRHPRWRQGMARVFWSGCVLLVISAVFFCSQKMQQDQYLEAVILTSHVEVRSAPEDSSTELFTLHEGVKLRILRQVPGWAQIHLADGKQGWLAASAVEKI